MNGKSAFPALRVKITVCLPSALMSVIGATIGLAADFESSPRWWLMDAIDVLCGHLPAVVVGHALAQLEGPGRGVRRCLPALRELADQRSVSGHFGQIIVVPVGHGDGEAILMRRRIEAVDGLAVGLAHAHDAALLGGAGEPDRHGECGCAGGAGLEESATGCSVHVDSSLRGTGVANSRCGGAQARERACAPVVPGTCAVDVRDMVARCPGSGNGCCHGCCQHGCCQHAAILANAPRHHFSMRNRGDSGRPDIRSA